MGVSSSTSVAIAIAILLTVPASLAALPFAAAGAPDVELPKDEEALRDVRGGAADGGIGAMAGCSEGDPTVALANNTAQTFSLSASSSFCSFSFVPTPGLTHNKVVLSWVSGSHDFDLYVRRGSPPTTSLYDCRPFISGSNETCQLDNDGQTVYVMVNSFSGSGSAAVVATSLTPPPTCALGTGTTTLSDATPITSSVTLDLGARCQFAYTVPAGFQLARFTLTPANASNDVNLYAKYGAAPSSSSPPTGSDCSSTSTGLTTDICSLTENGNTIFVTVYRPSTGTFDAGFTIRADAVNPCSLGTGTNALTPGVTTTATLSLDRTAKCFFSLDLPAGTNLARVNLTPSNTSNNVDLYGRYGVAPVSTTNSTLGVNNCASTSTSSTVDTCTMTGTGQTMFFTVYRPATGTFDATFNIRAEAVNTCSLGSGVIPLADGVSQLASLTWDVRASCLFSFSTGGVGDVARVNLSPVTDNFDLRIRKNAIPYQTGTLTSSLQTAADCFSNLTGTTIDSCVLSATGSDTFYALAVRNTAGTATRDLNIRADALTACTSSSSIVPVTAGVNASGNVGTFAGAACRFSFSPGSNDLATFSLTPTGTDNVDVYVRKNLEPTSSLYDCRSILAGAATTDSCTLSGLLSTDTIYVSAYRPANGAGNGGFNLAIASSSSCTLGGTATALADGVTQMAGFTVALSGAGCRFTFDPAPGTDVAKVTLNVNSTQDYDLYLRRGAAPTTTLYDCRPFSGAGVNETCVGVPNGQQFHAWVTYFGGGAGTFNVTAVSYSTCSIGLGTNTLLNNVGQLASLSNDVGSACQFVFDPAETEDTVTVTMAPPAAADFDLYLKVGAAPTTTVYDCKSSGGVGLVETCTLANDGTPVYAMVRRTSGSGEFSILARAFSPCSLGNADQTLGVDVSVTASLSSDAGAVCFFKLSPPAGFDLAAFSLAPATGDFDLYVKAGSRPSTSSYGCASTNVGGGAAESCTIPAGSGDLYAMVRRTDGDGDFTLIATVYNTCSLGQADTTLSDGVALSASLTGDAGAACFFSFAAPAGFDLAKISMTPASGDFDLYVRVGSRPTTSTFSCASTSVGDGGGELCSVGAGAGTVYAMVRRVSGSGSFTVLGTLINTCSLGQGDTVLTDGVSFSASLTDDSGAACFFKFDAGAAFDAAKATLTTGSGDFDLYVRTGSRPTTGSYTCASTTMFEDSCAIPKTGTIFVMVRRTSGSGSFSIKAESLSTCSLGPGTHALSAGSSNASLLPLTNAFCLFSYTPAPEDDFAKFVLQPTTPSDYNLYVKRGAAPTTASYDCRPNLGGASAETCESLVDGNATYFVMVARVSGSGNFTLTNAPVIIQTLQNGVASMANVASGAMTYYKVVVPEGASVLGVALVGSPIDSVCTPAPNNACTTASNADNVVCNQSALLNTVCTTANLSDVTIDRPNADLYARHKAGLPTTSAFDCRGQAAGTAEACAFSDAGVGALASAAANYTQARTDVWAACPDPTTCGANPLPTWPGLPANASLVPFKGAGKYFIAVRGVVGTPDFAIVAAYA